MRLIISLVLLSLLLACPEHRYPERGVELRYQAPEGARAAVERRLAVLHLVARLTQDGAALAVRVPEGGDVARVKSALARLPHFELCAEEVAVQRRWCEAAPDAGVALHEGGDREQGCLLDAARADALEATDGGPRVLAERSERGFVLHAAAPTCFTPRFLEAHARVEGALDAPVVALTLDDADARPLEALTRKLVRHRLLLVLDGAVLSAPVVMEPIPGGKLQLALPHWTPGDAEELAAALVGVLPRALTLESEHRYGPPSLR